MVKDIQVETEKRMGETDLIMQENLFIQNSISSFVDELHSMDYRYSGQSLAGWDGLVGVERSLHIFIKRIEGFYNTVKRNVSIREWERINKKNKKETETENKGETK